MTKNRKLQLKYFCLQYDEKKQEIENYVYMTSKSYSEIPKNVSKTDATYEKAERIARLKDEVGKIEKSIIETSKEFYSEILLNVTQNVRWEYMSICLSRRQFYRLKHKFFYKLDIKI